METNAHQTYKILNDTNSLVRPLCNAYEADHTGKRNSIISCRKLNYKTLEVAGIIKHFEFNYRNRFCPQWNSESAFILFCSGSYR